MAVGGQAHAAVTLTGNTGTCHSPACHPGPPGVDGEFERTTWHYPVAVEDPTGGLGLLRLKVTRP